MLVIHGHVLQHLPHWQHFLHQLGSVFLGVGLALFLHEPANGIVIDSEEEDGTCAAAAGLTDLLSDNLMLTFWLLQEPLEW